MTGLEKTNMPSQAKGFSLLFRDFKIIEISFKLNPDYKGWENEAKGWQGVPFEHDSEFELAHAFNEQEKPFEFVCLSI